MDSILVTIIACIGIALNVVVLIDTYFWYKGRIDRGMTKIFITRVGLPILMGIVLGNLMQFTFNLSSEAGFCMSLVFISWLGLLSLYFEETHGDQSEEEEEC